MPLKACLSFERGPPWRGRAEVFEQLCDDAADLPDGFEECNTGESLEPLLAVNTDGDNHN